MAFILSNNGRNYYESINNRKDGGKKFDYMFDIYYIGLLVGFSIIKLGDESDLEDEEFVKNYPGNYESISKLISGLLINAEMKRRDIQKKDRNSIERLIVDLISKKALGLSEEGMNLLNLYSAGGMNYIKDNIPLTDKLETFIVYVYKEINY